MGSIPDRVVGAGPPRGDGVADAIDGQRRAQADIAVGLVEVELTVAGGDRGVDRLPGGVEPPAEDVAPPDGDAGVRPADREPAVGGDRELAAAAVEAKRQSWGGVGGVDDEVVEFSITAGSLDVDDRDRRGAAPAVGPVPSRAAISRAKYNRCGQGLDREGQGKLRPADRAKVSVCIDESLTAITTSWVMATAGRAATSTIVIGASPPQAAHSPTAPTTARAHDRGRSEGDTA